MCELMYSDKNQHTVFGYSSSETATSYDTGLACVGTRPSHPEYSVSESVTATQLIVMSSKDFHALGYPSQSNILDVSLHADGVWPSFCSKLHIQGIHI